MKKEFIKIYDNYVYWVYLICTVCIVWIGVWRNIGTGAQWAFANNCLGFFAFIMIVCRYKIRDFLKISYLVWAIIFLILAYPAYKVIAPNSDYNAQYLSFVINVGLSGVILIRLFYQIFIEKNVNKRIAVPSFVLFCGMMVMCVISRNETIWPLFYFIMLIGLIIAPINRKNLQKIIKGIVDGIIVSFFWIQSRAFLYRPYDNGAAYLGHFNNENVNGMFYVLSESAILSKLWVVFNGDNRFTNSKRKILMLLKKAVLYALAISMVDFSLFTGSRCALLAILGMVGAWMFVYSITRKRRKCVILIANVLALSTVSIILIIPVYGCMRYIPALRHHPIWYGDYSEDKVHSWDPLDSEKYTSLDEALNGSAFARFIKYLPFLNQKSQELEISDSNSLSVDESSSSLQDGFISSNIVFKEMSGTDFSKNSIVELDNDYVFTFFVDSIVVATPIRTKEYPGGIWVYEYDDGVEPGTDSAHPAFIVERDSSGYWVDLGQYNPLDIRYFIWKYYIERLNLLGHKETHRYVYLSDEFGHAHNTFIQVAYYYGIIAGGLMLLLLFYIIIRGFAYTVRLKNDSCCFVFPMIFMIGFFLEGTFECLSFTGLMLYSMFYLVSAIFIISESQENQLFK